MLGAVVHGLLQRLQLGLAVAAGTERSCRRVGQVCALGQDLLQWQDIALLLLRLSKQLAENIPVNHSITEREGAGEERKGRAESVARLSLRWAYLLWCGKLGHLPKKLLQLMAEPAESKPKASTAPASPPALPGTHLQVPAVVTGTAQMSHEWRHLVGTKTHQLNMTQDFSNQGSLRCLWTPQHGSLLRRELPGATESTTTRLTLKAVWESQSS